MLMMMDDDDIADGEDNGNDDDVDANGTGWVPRDARRSQERQGREADGAGAKSSQRLE